MPQSLVGLPGGPAWAITMAKTDSDAERFNRIVVWSLAVTAVLLLVLPMFFVLSNETYYSAYVEGGDTDEEKFAQLSTMRSTLMENLDRGNGDISLGYDVANTISTPMLVNDWRDPHRSMLVIVGPEKPIDQTEARAIHNFVTESGGKVIVAAENSNANELASLFGVTFFDDPLHDENQHFLIYNDDGEPYSPSWRNVWSAASVNQDVESMQPAYLSQVCTDDQIRNNLMTNCRLPVMFRSPTGMKFEPTEMDETNPDHRSVKILARASSGAFIDVAGTLDAGDYRNPAPGDLALVIRADYPVKAFDKPQESQGGFVGTTEVAEVDVTGSITFVADDEAFSNMLWDLQQAQTQGIRSNCDTVNSCWLDVLPEGQWNGNSAYFSALIFDMMEHRNPELSSTFRDDKSQYQIVFDESRHSTGRLSAPFVETMGTVVLLTSNPFLKWLVVLNVGLLLLVSMMVVPQKENWRHVFDLTRFKERPGKLDPSTYRERVQQALFTKVRVHYDLTRDQLALKPPSEVQDMINDPKLVELAYSKSRVYQSQELRQLMVAIRKWGKPN